MFINNRFGTNVGDELLRDRGQMRDVSTEALSDLKALEQRAEERLERTKTEEASK